MNLDELRELQSTKQGGRPTIGRPRMSEDGENKQQFSAMISAKNMSWITAQIAKTDTARGANGRWLEKMLNNLRNFPSTTNTTPTNNEIQH